MLRQRINSYKCKSGHITVTIDRDLGVTPMMLTCRQHNANGTKCQETATSSFYMCDPALIPEFEWYRPGQEVKLEAIERDHVNHGGLLLRKLDPNNIPSLDPFIDDSKLDNEAINALNHKDKIESKFKPIQPRKVEPKPDRNAQCPCGSGKKYKNCCYQRLT